MPPKKCAGKLRWNCEFYTDRKSESGIDFMGTVAKSP